MYLCVICESEFDRPAVRRWSEPRPDGFREYFCHLICPVCGYGEQYFTKITETGDESYDKES